MYKLLFGLVLLVVSLVAFAGYQDGQSFGGGIMPSKHSLFSKSALSNVPGHKDSSSHGLDNESAIESRAASAMENSEAGQFLMDAASRDSKFDIGEQDAIMLSADRHIANPLESVSDAFRGKVKKLANVMLGAKYVSNLESHLW